MHRSLLLRITAAATCLAWLLVCLGCGRPAVSTSDEPRADRPATETPHLAQAATTRAAEGSDTTGADNVGVAGAPGQPSAARGLVRQVAHTEKPSPKAAAPAKKKFDYGPLFVDWPKPKLALVISGLQNGYLEPCGCAGLENQKGGLSRRYTFIQQLRERGWPVAAIDVGGLVRRFGKQSEIQFAIAAEALKQMGYSAVGFGPADLRLSAGEIVAAVAGPQPNDSIFVSANVNLFGLTPKVRIIEAGGLKLGITAVLGNEFQQQVNNTEVEIAPAAESISQVIGEIKNCDIRILLAQATMDESKALVKQFPEFQFVVSGAGADEPPAQPEKIPGTRSRLIEVGHKGMFVIVAGFYDDPKMPVRFQRVALDSQFADAPEMKALMTTYQDQLQQLGWSELGLKAAAHPRAQKGEKADKLAGQFASAASCKDCHPTAYNVWSKTKHAHATETLVKLNPPRQYDPECISCHSTGWNPTEFYPYATGFESMEKTPQLAGNSCENCHGPSAAHVAAEKGRNSTKKEAERQLLKLTVGTAQEQVCAKCHDHDNSPDFNEESFKLKYWPKVEHKGKR